MKITRNQNGDFIIPAKILQGLLDNIQTPSGNIPGLEECKTLLQEKAIILSSGDGFGLLKKIGGHTIVWNNEDIKMIYEKLGFPIDEDTIGISNKPYIVRNIKSDFKSISVSSDGDVFRKWTNEEIKLINEIF